MPKAPLSAAPVVRESHSRPPTGQALLIAYFQNLYRRTIDEGYRLAFDRVAKALREGVQVPHCGIAECGAT